MKIINYTRKSISFWMGETQVITLWFIIKIKMEQNESYTLNKIFTPVYLQVPTDHINQKYTNLLTNTTFTNNVSKWNYSVFGAWKCDVIKKIWNEQNFIFKNLF